MEFFNGVFGKPPPEHGGDLKENIDKQLASLNTSEDIAKNVLEGSEKRQRLEAIEEHRKHLMEERAAL